MKIKYGKLKKLIREAQVEILQEQSSTPSYLIEFAKAYASLEQGEADQFDQLVNMWYLGGHAVEDNVRRAAASGDLGSILDRLAGPIDGLDGSDARDLQELFRVVRSEHSGNHPMDTDGDGNVDWDEIQ
tara:strand:- start:2155 stop:2541 length:387 start_codon:yes stop_codon:yes gene_type:complete